MYKYISLAVVIFLFIIAAAALIVMSNRSKLSPVDVTTLFYKEWIRVAEHTDGTPLEKDLHARSTYVTQDFAVVADKADATWDPVVCSTEKASDVYIEPMKVDETRANVDVFIDGASEAVRVILIKDDRGWWRIDEIDCPTLPPATSSEEEMSEEETATTTATTTDEREENASTTATMTEEE